MSATMSTLSRSLLFFLLFFLLFAARCNVAAAGDWIYPAQEGDTLWDLCLKYTNKRGCWIELSTYNDVRNDRAIPIGTEIRIPYDWLIRPPVVGQVIALEGPVSYQGTPTSPAKPLQAGQELRLGARLVSTTGSARLEFGPGNELLLRPGSTVELDTMSGPSAERRRAEIDLEGGSLDIRVRADGKSRFRINTPAAIAAVRGTEYRVDSLGSGESMRSEVLSGSVEVAASGASTLVPAGFGVAATKGQPPGQQRRLLEAPVFAADYGAVTLPASIAWNANPDAVSWQLDLATTGASGALLQSYQTRAPEHVFEDLGQGCYALTVRAVDADGFKGLDRKTPLCIVPRLAAVSELSVVTDDPQDGIREIYWSPVEKAKRYRVEIASDASFATLLDTQETSATELAITRPADEAFHVRVIALDAAGNESPTGATASFDPPEDVPWGLVVLAVVYLLALL
jgi:hypothetical protein